MATRYTSPCNDFERTLKWTYGGKYYLQASTKAFHDMLDRNHDHNERIPQPNSKQLLDISKRAFEKGELYLAEKFLGMVIRKQNIEDASMEGNAEPYHNLAEVLRQKASKLAMHSPEKQKLLLQATALYNFVRNCLKRKGAVESEFNSYLRKCLPEKIANVQDEIIAAVGGNPYCCKFNFEGKKKAMDGLREEVRNDLKVVNSKYNTETESDEELREIFIKQAIEIRNLFRKIACRVKQLFIVIIEECVDVLGEPPCDYEVLLLGSLAREEMTPYSDLEWAILTSSEEEECKIFFRNLTNLVHFQIINLGETILTCMDIEVLKEDWFYDDVTPRGLSFDSLLPRACKTPLGNMPNFELIHDPVAMANFQSNDWHKKNPSLGDILLTVAPLNDSKNALLKEYKTNVEKLLREPCDNCAHHASSTIPTRGVCRGQRILLKDTKRYGQTLLESHKIYDGKLYDVKKEIYRLTDRVIAGLSKVFGVGANSCFEILEELSKRNIICSSGRDNLASAAAIALKLRLSTYILANKQDEDIKSQSKEETVGNDAISAYRISREKELFHFFYVTTPLYELIFRFCTDDMKSSECFLSNLFFDCSDVIRGHTHCRILNYVAALDCYDRALDANPRNIDLQLRQMRIEFMLKKSSDVVPKMTSKLETLLQEMWENSNSGAVLVPERDGSIKPMAGKCEQEFIAQLIEIHLFNSELNLSQGDTKNAGAILRQCEKLEFELSDLHKLIVRLELVRISQKQLTRTEYDEINSQLTALIKDEGISVRGLVWLNELGVFLVHHGKNSEAYRCFQRALTMGRTLFGSNLNFNIVLTLYWIGTVCVSLGIFEEGKFYLAQTLALLPSSEDHFYAIMVKDVYRQLAVVSTLTYDHTDAIFYSEKALDLRVRGTSLNQLIDCMTYCRMASIWSKLDENEKALQSVLDAKNHLTNDFDMQQKVSMTCLVSQTFMEIGESGEAMLLLNHAFNTENDVTLQLEYLNSLGQLCVQQSLMEDAECYYKKALDMLRFRNGNTVDILPALVGISWVLIKNKKWSEAVGYLNDASKYISTMLDNDEKCKYLKRMAECWEEIGDYNNARKCLENAVKVFAESAECAKMLPFDEFDLHVMLGDLVGKALTCSSSNSEQMKKSQRIHYDRAAVALRRHSAAGNYNATTVRLFGLLAWKYDSIDLLEEEKLLFEALNTCEHIYGPENTNELMASTLSNLVDVYLNKKEYDSALDFFDRSLAMELEIHCTDPYHTHITRQVNLLDILFSESAQWQQLENRLQRILIFLERHNNDKTLVYSVEKAKCSVSMARLCYFSGDLERAERFSQIAGDIFERVQIEDETPQLLDYRNSLMTFRKMVERVNTSNVLNPNMLRSLFLSSREIFEENDDDVPNVVKSSQLCQRSERCKKFTTHDETIPSGDTEDTFSDNPRFSLAKPSSGTDKDDEVNTVSKILGVDANVNQSEYCAAQTKKLKTDLERIQSVADTVIYENKQGDAALSLKTLEDSLVPSLVSFYKTLFTDPVQHLINEAEYARKTKNVLEMIYNVNLTSKFPLDSERKAKVSKMNGEYQIYMQNYRAAAISFDKAVCFHRSISTGLELDHHVEYAESLIGLTKSHLLCNELEEAWNVCQEGVAIMSSTQHEVVTCRLLVELLYLAAKCALRMSTHLTLEEDLEQVVSFCKQALGTCDELEDSSDLNDVTEELQFEKGEFFVLKCEIKLLIASTLFRQNNLEEAHKIVKELKEFLQNVAVVLELFSNDTWPAGVDDFSKIQRRLFSLIGRASVILDETGSALINLKKSLSIFFAPSSPGAMLPVEEIIPLLDAITATIETTSKEEKRTRFQKALEICKRQYLEENQKLIELWDFFATSGNHYVDCGRIGEAIVVYETALAIARCLEGTNRNECRGQTLLYLANAHRLQAIGNLGKGVSEENRLAEKYYQSENGNSTENSSIMKNIMYAYVLCDERRFEEAAILLERVAEFDDTLWSKTFTFNYSKRALFGIDIQRFIESYGEIITNFGNLVYALLVRVQVQNGDKSEAVRAYYKLSKDGKDLPITFGVVSPCLPYLLHICEKYLVSLIKEPRKLSFEKSDFPLSAGNLAKLYYELGEYKMTLKMCEKAQTSTRSASTKGTEFSGQLSMALLTANALVMSGASPKWFHYKIFLTMLQQKETILDKSFVEQQAILTQFSFAEPYHVYRLLGMMLAERNIDGRIACYEFCLSLDPVYSIDQSVVGSLADLYQTKALTDGLHDEETFQQWIDKAEGCFQKLLDKNFKMAPFVESTFASFLHRTKRSNEAIFHFKQVIAGETGNEEITLTQVNIPLCDVHLVREIEARGKVTLPTKIYVCYQMLLVYLECRRLQEARESLHHMEEYVKLYTGSPNYAIIITVLAYSFKETGMERNASEMFKAVLDREPDNKRVKLALNELQTPEQKQ